MDYLINDPPIGSTRICTRSDAGWRWPGPGLVISAGRHWGP